MRVPIASRDIVLMAMAKSRCGVQAIGEIATSELMITSF